MTVDREGTDYVVRYSVAEWFLEEIAKAGTRL